MKINFLVVLIKAWKNRNGVYTSVSVYINGNRHFIEPARGGEWDAQERVLEFLRQLGPVTKEDQSLWSFCANRNIPYIKEFIWVKNKAEMSAK